MDALPVGSGRLDLFGFMRGDERGGRAGAAAELAARVTEGLSLFGQGTGFYEWDRAGRRFGYEATAGMRMRW